jgi:hypothetical protein
LPQIDRKLRAAILAALILLGGWLRFASIDFGLPDKFRPDEEMLVLKALDLGRDLNPRFNEMTYYPAGQVYVVNAVLHSYAALTGGGANLEAAYAANSQSRAYLIAREVSAAMGTATIAAVYWAADGAFGPVPALCSAAIVTVAGIHVRESKFAKMQAPTGLWLALAMGMMLRIVRRGRRSDYALAGVFSALATATNYQAVPIVLGVLAAHLERRHRENRPLLTALADIRIYIAGFATMLTFFCATPYTILDPHFARDYAFAHMIGVPEARGWSFLMFRLMPDTLGITLLSVLLLGVLWAIYRPKLGTFCLLALTAATLLTMTAGKPSLIYRYSLNPLLVMALLAGVFAADLLQFASARLGPRRGIAAWVALFALMLMPSLVHDVQLDRLLAQKDTRVLARWWIHNQIPPSAAIAETDYDPFWNLYGKPQQSQELASYYKFSSLEDPQLRRVPRFWVVSDSLPGLARFSPGPTPAEQKALDSEATLVLDINPIKEGTPMPVFDPSDAFYVPFQHISSMDRPGPRIRIWKVDRGANEGPALSSLESAPQSLDFLGYIGLALRCPIVPTLSARADCLYWGSFIR